MSDKRSDCEPVPVLWTGGWDSTFQVLRLLLEQHRAVLPIYLIKESRRSIRAELLAMKKIRGMLAAYDPKTKTLLRPLCLHTLTDIPENSAITAAFKEVRAKKYIGQQYDWLARFCAWQHIPDLQLCIHKDDMAHAVLADLVVEDPPGSQTYRMSPMPQATPEQLLFGPFTYPLFDFTKQAMARVAQQQGWHDIMMQTWFCHHPTKHGKPCGVCNPCQYTIAEGLGWRISPHRRYLRALHKTLMTYRQLFSKPKRSH